MATPGSRLGIERLPAATRILGTATVLLVIDGLLLPWQAAGVSVWAGSGAWAGVITGILAVALLAVEGIQLAGTHVVAGVPAARIGAGLGFGILAFGTLTFLLVVTDGPAIGAFIGILLSLAIGYGAWMRVQEPASPSTPS
jgi:hypothetical protein